MILYGNRIWRDVNINRGIFYEYSKFNVLEQKIISLLYGRSTNASENLLSEKDFHILEKLIALGHDQSKVAYKKYEEVLRNHELKQAAIFISVTCAVLLFLLIVGYILHKSRKKILDKFTKTKTQRLGIVFFILTLVFMCLEEGQFFRLDDEEYLFFIFVPMVLSAFMIFGITDFLYKWVCGTSNVSCSTPNKLFYGSWCTDLKGFSFGKVNLWITLIVVIALLGTLELFFEYGTDGLFRVIYGDINVTNDKNFLVKVFRFASVLNFVKGVLWILLSSIVFLSAKNHKAHKFNRILFMFMSFCAIMYGIRVLSKVLIRYIY